MDIMFPSFVQFITISIFKWSLRREETESLPSTCISTPSCPSSSTTVGGRIRSKVACVGYVDVNIYVPESAKNLISPENQEIPEIFTKFTNEKGKEWNDISIPEMLGKFSDLKGNWILW